MQKSTKGILQMSSSVSTENWTLDDKKWDVFGRWRPLQFFSDQHDSDMSKLRPVPRCGEIQRHALRFAKIHTIVKVSLIRRSWLADKRT